MKKRAGFTVYGMALLAVLFAGASLSADDPQSFEQQRTQLPGDAPDPSEPAAGARPDPKLEETRLRLEREVQARRQMTGDVAADPDNQRRDMRFGVGYEFRMRGRQELGFDSPGGFAGGEAGPGPGPGGGRGFGNGRR